MLVSFNFASFEVELLCQQLLITKFVTKQVLAVG